MHKQTVFQTITDDNYEYRFEYHPDRPEEVISTTIVSLNDTIEVAPKPAAPLASRIKQSAIIYLTGTFKKHRKLRDVRNFIEYLYEHDITRIFDTSCMFQHCESLEDIRPLAYLPMTYTVKASFMFSWCCRLTDISPLSQWDVSRIRNIHAMFLNCTTLHDISSLSTWNPVKARKRGFVFGNCGISTGVEIARRIDPSHVHD